MRWVFLSLALALLAWSSLVVVQAWNKAVWQAAIVAGEFGHYLGIVALVLACAIVAHGAVLGVSDAASPRREWLLVGGGFAASLVATGLFLAPAVMASLVGQRLPQAVEQGLGAKVSTFRVTSFGDMLLATPRVERVGVSTRVFAGAGTADALSLDFYAPTGVAVTGRVPCVIVVHGGGWDGGDREQLVDFNHWLAGEGYAVAAVSYRLAPEHPWPAQGQDVLVAIAWLKAHAAELGIDAGRLVLMGRSAGAQIASAVAYGAPDEAVRGFIGLYGVYDMNFVWSLAREDDVLNSVKLMNQFLGGEPTLENRERYDSASAQGMVRQGVTPPTLLMHGTIDTLCWVEHSRRLAAKLDDEGVPHVLVELPWGVHAFDYNLHGPGGQLTRYAVREFLRTVCAER
ncbi:alpha/beta hydrolase [Actomonas aquatica]|uniref:Alpha/beta hydrolase n=1 Tax=Actomonas aquatica TaxID=2866162 RepID=A0ABZ1C214_9BACT|nr:alpha/beta hydrolase [Opitutus sp. WL0086]WRQ85706.1 alpha/beta hydrolase [Opitutus sp. WL0086]